MRLKEFADLKDYTQPTVADAEHFVKQLQRIWPDRSEDELAPAILRNRKKALDTRRKLLDATNER
jgi:hypothetical protein